MATMDIDPYNPYRRLEEENETDCFTTASPFDSIYDLERKLLDLKYTLAQESYERDLVKNDAIWWSQQNKKLRREEFEINILKRKAQKLSAMRDWFQSKISDLQLATSVNRIKSRELAKKLSSKGGEEIRRLRTSRLYDARKSTPVLQRRTMLPPCA
mmetsp:Transcript_9383/g.21609  ORF Transcript_9383/g.21609 Transcript_9383/m.21609 type:complete len:157 (+) Transcript_9383:66-536(+)